MHEPYRSPDPEPGAGDSAYPVGQHETRAFDAYPHGGYSNHALETQAFAPVPLERHPQNPQHAPYPQDQQHAPYPPGPAYEPLAHEGGLPYGAPPAPAHNMPPQQFIPQHLAMPPQFAHNPYGPQFPQPYMYPQQMQQTVFVNNNGRRVNHILHLVLTLITAGLWLPIWIILAIANS